MWIKTSYFACYYLKKEVSLAILGADRRQHSPARASNQQYPELLPILIRYLYSICTDTSLDKNQLGRAGLFASSPTIHSALVQREILFWITNILGTSVHFIHSTFIVYSPCESDCFLSCGDISRWDKANPSLPSPLTTITSLKLHLLSHLSLTADTTRVSSSRCT